MIDRREFQDYLNFLVAAGSRAEELVDVPADYPNHLRAGLEYEQLVTLPGYKRLLDDMEKRADAALAALRLCESSDMAVVKGLRDRWREAEDSLKFIQIRATEAIERRKAIISDLGMRFGINESGLDIDDTADRQAMKDHIGGHNADFVTLSDDDNLNSELVNHQTNTISQPGMVVEGDITDE